ncbi:MAG: LysR family transcriptional regulator [Gammaproteobacteria bacterium]|nr:LysR family transcriptional regulator [Gammaproteobacteria bacterium]PCH62596.1 MAG: LysR family transcriptional regulator [Gammaproteobacteria bacterium]PCH64513.1 MAG: LysR family transcriptional regulator [Gammaproteobacteria bacterium]
MFIELRQLRSLKAIYELGNLTRAAQQLNVTQSALSHQIRSIERYFGLSLFIRKQKQLQLTVAGERLFALAQRIVPQVEETELALQRMAEGSTGRLNIAIECHSCFDWLLPLLDQYRERWPNIEVDVRLGISLDPWPSLASGDIDTVITSDKTEQSDIVFESLFDYEALLAVARDHPLTSKQYIEPHDLGVHTLITYAVPQHQLDIFNYFLTPANVEPASQRSVELTALMLQLVASGRGVAALPNWVLADSLAKNTIAARPLGRKGMHGTMYAAVRQYQRQLAHINEFIVMARQRMSLN